MSNREILDKCIYLDKSCLTDLEKKQVKDTFSLRDEIVTCPNIEVEIDFTDKSLFFIRLYHVK